MGKSIYTRVIKHKFRSLYFDKPMEYGSLWTQYREEAKQFHNQSLAERIINKYDLESEFEIKLISI